MPRAEIAIIIVSSLFVRFSSDQVCSVWFSWVRFVSWGFDKPVSCLANCAKCKIEHLSNEQHAQFAQTIRTCWLVGQEIGKTGVVAIVGWQFA